MGICACNRRVAPKRPLVITLHGGPGSGVTTQAQKIKSKYGMKVLKFSTIFEKAVYDGSDLGKRIEVLLKAKKPIPGSISVPLLREAIKEAPYNESGFIIERWPGQQEDIEGCPAKATAEINMITVYIKLDPDTMQMRSLSKTVEINPNTTEYQGINSKIETQIQFFLRNTVPMISHKKTFGQVYEIDGERSLQDVTSEISTIIDRSL
jgi:adenylate kinase family enzyme